MFKQTGTRRMPHEQKARKNRASWMNAILEKTPPDYLPQEKFSPKILRPQN